MNGPEPTGSLPRVVVFSRDAALVGTAGPLTGHCIFPETPFEAAAELLAEPTDALVVDLDVLPPAHLRLLQVARRSGTPIILTGRLRAALDADTLSGARLVARNELAAEIARIAPRTEHGDGKVVLAPAKPADREGNDAQQSPPPTPRPTLSLDHPVLTPDELSALLEDAS